MLGTTLNCLKAWKVIYFFVNRELHNLNATQRLHPSPCNKTATTVTCSQHNTFIWDQKRGAISCLEKGNLFHVIHIILPILRQFRAFGTFQGRIKI